MGGRKNIREKSQKMKEEEVKLMEKGIEDVWVEQGRKEGARERK